MAIGAWWYSPGGFAKQWTKYTKIDIMKIPTAQANKIIMFVALPSLVQSVTLAIILHTLNVMSLTEGVLAGLLLWFGLVTA